MSFLSRLYQFLGDWPFNNLSSEQDLKHDTHTPHPQYKHKFFHIYVYIFISKITFDKFIGVHGECAFVYSMFAMMSMTVNYLSFDQTLVNKDIFKLLTVYLLGQNCKHRIHIYRVMHNLCPGRCQEKKWEVCIIFENFLYQYNPFYVLG